MNQIKSVQWFFFRVSLLMRFLVFSIFKVCPTFFFYLILNFVTIYLLIWYCLSTILLENRMCELSIFELIKEYVLKVSWSFLLHLICGFELIVNVLLFRWRLTLYYHFWGCQCCRRYCVWCKRHPLSSKIWYLWYGSLYYRLR